MPNKYSNLWSSANSNYTKTFVNNVTKGVVPKTKSKVKQRSSHKPNKYFVRDLYTTPEMVVTPKRSGYVTDQYGNPSISVGALGDINPNAPIYTRNKIPSRGLPDMRNFRTQPTNQEASKYADYHAAKTAPTIGDLVMGGVGKPMNLISPVHWYGAIRDWDKNKGWGNIWEDNSGLVTKEYAEKHPWRALALNAVGDLVTGGTIKGVKNAIRIGKNIKNRNLFSYKYLDPAGYDNLYPRFKNWAYHIIHDPSFKKGEIPIPEDVVQSNPFKRKLFREDKAFNTFRHESFRKYLGIPEEYGMYIDNGDGTWRYNKKIIQDILEEDGKIGSTIGLPKHSLRVKEATPYTSTDFITTSGGNVAIIPKSRKDLGNGLIEHIDDMYDPWDVTPGAVYNTIIKSLPETINGIVRQQADNIYTKLYNKVYRHRLPYKYLGGRKLNNIRYDFDIKRYPKINKLITKIANTEVGPILGGKPFIMRTPMKYYTKKVNKPVPNNTNIMDIRKFYLDLMDNDPLEFTYGDVYKNGGTIHINPANRGKFNATKRRTGKTTEELTHSKNPKTRKRAIFAQNAAKWRKRG